MTKCEVGAWRLNLTWVLSKFYFFRATLNLHSWCSFNFSVGLTQKNSFPPQIFRRIMPTLSLAEVRTRTKNSREKSANSRETRFCERFVTEPRYSPLIFEDVAILPEAVIGVRRVSYLNWTMWAYLIVHRRCAEAIWSWTSVPGGRL